MAASRCRRGCHDRGGRHPEITRVRDHRGLPVQVGLYTAFVPLIVYAMLGSSRPMSVTTTTTLAILTGAELAIVSPDGDPTLLLSACALLTLMVGAILVLASICRLGFVANFISEPVLVGFKAGIGP
jgi:MFS superfamily sulfate permease-like transporter